MTSWQQARGIVICVCYVISFAHRFIGFSFTIHTRICMKIITSFWESNSFSFIMFSVKYLCLLPNLKDLSKMSLRIFIHRPLYPFGIFLASYKYKSQNWFSLKGWECDSEHVLQQQPLWFKRFFSLS